MKFKIDQIHALKSVEESLENKQHFDPCMKIDSLRICFVQMPF